MVAEQILVMKRVAHRSYPHGANERAASRSRQPEPRPRVGGIRNGRFVHAGGQAGPSLLDDEHAVP